jgi:hypothetical protein
MAKTQIMRIVEVTIIQLQIAEVDSTKPIYWDEDAKIHLRKDMQRDEIVQEDWRELSTIEKAILST